MNERQLKQAHQLIEGHEHDIHSAWRQHFVAEVTNISKNGVWLLLADEELFMAYEDFPWFRSARVDDILDVEWPSPNHLYWVSLDIDLAVESIRDPSKFPLQASS